MSSTSNAQDLLVNVFRPTYTYDSTTGFTPALVVSNVSELIVGRINTDRLAVADSNGNSYVGCNAGPALANLTTYSNIAIGVSAMAGASNSSNNVSVGISNFSGLSNANSNVGLGANTLMTGTGQKNILIGANVVLGSGSGNIVIGNDLSLGTISNTLRLGNLLYGNLTTGFIGINNPVPAAALDISGEVLFRNKVGVQKTNPIYTLDVAGSIYATEQIIGGKGTQSNPMYTFIDSSGSGMYVPVDPSYGTGSFGIAVNRKAAAIFSSNAVNFFQNLDVSGTFSARNVDLSAFSVTDGTESRPSVKFINDLSTGLYLVSSNRLGVTTGGVRRMEVLSNGDVSYSGRIVGSDAAACNVIGGVTLQNGFVVTTGSTTSAKLAVQDGTAAAPSYTFVTDPSSGFHLVGTSRIGFDTAGLQRMCISGGNVGIGRTAPVVALDVQGDVSATTYNGPGGTAGAPHFTSSDDRTTGVFFPGANIVGVTAGGTERMRISNGNIGIGTTAPANALDVSGTLRVIGVAGNITFTNGAIAIGGSNVISATGVLSNAITTSNSIGGVTLNNGVVSNASSSVNAIGGVTLSNTNISYAGAITGTTASASNQIGGVTLSNTNISYAGTITGSTDNTSNKIGGVTLSNTNIAYAGAITGATASASNQIGGITLSNSNAIVGGFLRNALVPTTWDISGGNISNSGTTRSANFLAVPGGAPRPGFAFTTDPSSGIDLPGTSQIAFETAGVQRMVISNANVGIGTTAPAFALDVSGVANVQTAGAGGTLNVGGSTGLFMFCDAVTTKHGYIRALGSTANLYLGTSNTNHMMITNGGFVGIGTTAPQYALDVSGSAQVTGGLLVTDTNVSRVNNVNLYTNSTQAIVEAYKRDLTLWDDLVFRTANNTTNATRMTITGSNGFVGIGTTNPGQTLVVNGTAAATQFNVGDGTVGAPSLTFTGETTTGFYRAAATDVRYATGGVDRLYFAGTRLGVGIVPTVALDVQGTVRGRAGVVFTSGGVGYLRDTLNSPSVDISNGNISNAGTTTSLTFVGNGTIPVGGIIMWSGTIAAIPTGWALCDGNNGTPNLVNRFVMAAGNLYGVGEFGGATSNRLTPMNIPPHKHTIPQSYNANQGGGSTITYVGMGQPPQISPGNASIYNSDNVLQTAQGNNPEQFSILNPYYALAYIMRTT